MHSFAVQDGPASEVSCVVETMRFCCWKRKPQNVAAKGRRQRDKVSVWR